MSNIVYVLKGSWKVKKSLLFFMAVRIFAMGAESYVPLLVTKFVIDGIESGKEVKEFLVVVVAAVLFQMVMSLIQSFGNHQIWPRLGYVSTQYQLLRVQKIHTIDYELLESQQMQDLVKRAEDGADGLYSRLEEVQTEIYQRSNKGRRRKMLADDANMGLELFIQTGIMYAWMVYDVLFKGMTIGNFTLYLGSIRRFGGAVSNVFLDIVSLRDINRRLNDFRTFMEYPGMMQEEEIVELPEAETYTFVFEHVWFHYPGHEEYVLKDVSVTIEGGKRLAVVGPNGAGKSTFIKLLCRLYPVTEGDILLNGKSIYSYGMSEYRRILSVVFQDFKLFSFSIRDNLLMAAGTEELADARLKEVCMMAGFGERLSEFPKGLDTGLYKNFYEDGVEPSGGEAQKLAIARALCKSAPVVILDEPTAALDPLAEAEIYEHFQEMSRGRTAIFISHRLSSCQFCDRVVVFAKHGIAENGPHKELVKRPDGIYAAMFRAQAENYR